MKLQNCHKTCVALTILLSAIAITLNHMSLQLGYHVPDSEQQRESIDRGRLSVLGPIVVDVDFDGSVVSPDGFGNDARTFVIDAVIILQAIGLLSTFRQKKT